VAAETNLLKSAEQARDLLAKLVAGEKDQLDRIFGGTCERIGRLRIALDQVTISQMHAKDKRWHDLRSVVETIESVLKDLGTFRPWVPAATAAPSNLGYRGLRRRYSPGRRVNLKPEHEGGEPENFEISPSLPNGLELSASTGVIAGTLPLGELVEECSYTIVAKNASGSAECVVSFAVTERPPIFAYPVSGGYPASSGPRSSISLESSPVTAPESPPEPRKVLLGEEIRILPAVEGGCSPNEWALEGDLPKGLQFDKSTGAIFGKATEATPEPRSLEVIGSNSGGSGRAKLLLEVALVPPTSLEVAGHPDSISVGEEVSIAPKVQGHAETWRIEPALPSGLAMDAATGIITGAALVNMPPTTFRVVAQNAAGEASTEITLEVKVVKPSGLSFDGFEESVPKVFALQQPVSAGPTVSGSVDKYSVSPRLPSGLELDPTTGLISGVPTETMESRDYVVTASNSAGSTSVSLQLEVKLTPPLLAGYEPSFSSKFVVGDSLGFSPTVVGPATDFQCDPELPEGLTIDSDTGKIVGVLSRSAPKAEYSIVASNDAGDSEVFKIAFSVAPAAPQAINYGESPVSITAGEAVKLTSIVEVPAGSFEGTFSVDPSLPEGLTLDAKTGCIEGTAAESAEEATYKITASNEAGEVSLELALVILEPVQTGAILESIDEKFAKKLDAIENLEDLPPEPSRDKIYGNFGNWMLWMVHRAHLNDPTLVDFNFNNLHMPEPHVEERLAPKLVKAMATNTHIKTLSLMNSNLMKPQGVSLAESLRTNQTLQILDISCNSLDSDSVREVAVALYDNPGSVLEQMRLSPQKLVANGFFGRPVEEAMGMLLERNRNLTKIGFECHDANWRNTIDRALLRNNDTARRRRTQGRLSAVDDLVPAEDRGLSQVRLLKPPTEAPSQSLSPSTAGEKAFWGFVCEKKQLPDATQLRSFAKTMGEAMKYAESAPTIKDCRSKLLAAATGTEVSARDIFQADTDGMLRKWNDNGNTKVLEVWPSDGSGKRYAYKTDSELMVFMSEEWAAWLKAQTGITA